MTHQTHGVSDAAPAIGQLRSLSAIGGEGVRRVVETDLTPKLPFLVDASWYQDYWYGDTSPANWNLRANTVRRLCYEVPRGGVTICRTIARTMRRLSASPSAT